MTTQQVKQIRKRQKQATTTAKVNQPDMQILEIKRDGKGKIYSHVRKKWLVETPEEIVRQKYLLVLVNEYQFFSRSDF